MQNVFGNVYNTCYFCFTIGIDGNHKSNKMKISCISVHGINHEMKLLESDLTGFYLYKLIPMELGYEDKIMYIGPNREDHWMYAKPFEGGKQIKSSEILYFHRYN